MACGMAFFFVLVLFHEFGFIHSLSCASRRILINFSLQRPSSASRRRMGRRCATAAATHSIRIAVRASCMLHR
ncbi:hypothetical protein BJ912DRAFT_983744 [Pholiota molesta]|nr:hypothetical protein BJ912DRAFT_983744 [Pholiota molesta]